MRFSRLLFVFEFKLFYLFLFRRLSHLVTHLTFECVMRGDSQTFEL